MFDVFRLKNTFLSSSVPFLLFRSLILFYVSCLSRSMLDHQLVPFSLPPSVLSSNLTYTTRYRHKIPSREHHLQDHLLHNSAVSTRFDDPYQKAEVEYCYSPPEEFTWDDIWEGKLTQVAGGNAESCGERGMAGIAHRWDNEWKNYDSETRFDQILGWRVEACIQHHEILEYYSLDRSSLDVITTYLQETTPIVCERSVISSRLVDGDNAEDVVPEFEK